MTFYDGQASPNSRRVRTFLAEKGAIIPMMPVSLMERVQRQLRYREKNYYCDIPLMEFVQAR